jgi:hypothetical protein
MAEIEIRLLREEDIDPINDLYKRSYGISRSREKFVWEFVKCPVRPAIYIVAVDAVSLKIVGTQCAIPLYVRMPSGEVVLTAKSEDTLVDVSYRGLSIFERMYQQLFEECRLAGIQYVWGFTYAIKPFKKILFDIPFRSNFGLISFDPVKSHKILNALKRKRSGIEKFKIFTLVSFSFLFQKIKSISKSKLQKKRISIEPQIETNSLFHGSNFCYLNQDELFINWRITKNPYNDHLHYSLLSADGRSEGNVICSVHSNHTAYLMQIVFHDSVKQSDKLSFLRYVVRDLSKKVALLRFWGFENTQSGKEEIVLLKKVGFTFTDRGISFVWKHLGKSDKLDLINLKLSRLSAQSSE